MQFVYFDPKKAEKRKKELEEAGYHAVVKKDRYRSDQLNVTASMRAGEIMKLTNDTRGKKGKHYEPTPEELEEIEKELTL